MQIFLLFLPKWHQLSHTKVVHTLYYHTFWRKLDKNVRNRRKSSSSKPYAFFCVCPVFCGKRKIPGNRSPESETFFFEVQLHIMMLLMIEFNFPAKRTHVCNLKGGVVFFCIITSVCNSLRETPFKVKKVQPLPPYRCFPLSFSDNAISYLSAG